MSNKDALFDYLMEQIPGCNYISDLKNTQYRENIHSILHTLDPQKYSLEVWSETLSYLTQLDIHLKDYDEITKYIS